jgi:hypothetical protein
VTFSLKNKIVFAPKPSPSVRYQVSRYPGKRKCFCDLYFIYGNFMNKMGYLFSIKIAVINL